MKALVTGGAGFIGSALANALLDQGASVRVLDDLSAGSEDAIPSGAELIRGDIRDPIAAEKACEQIDAVFHQAAVRSVPRSVEEPAFVHETNATGTLNMLISATKCGVRRFVYASSGSVYGGTVGETNLESMPTRPLSPYGISKLTGEHYCRVWSDLYGLGTVSLRYFNVFGPGQRHDSKYAALFPAFVTSLKAGYAPEIHWDGDQTRDFAYVDDVVRANLLAAIDDSRTSGAVVNIAGGRSRSVNEVFQSISEVLGCEIKPRYVPKRQGDIRESRADISRARELLGWTPTADWSEAVKATVDWFVRKTK